MLGFITKAEEPAMSRDTIVRFRSEAFRRQAGRCYYCHVLMWIDDCASFAEQYRISKPVARWLQCTAEHLQARRDGGKDVAPNIAAACKRCNAGRHRRKDDVSPDRFRALVKRRVTRGKWHDLQVHKSGLVPIRAGCPMPSSFRSSRTM